MTVAQDGIDGAGALRDPAPSAGLSAPAPAPAPVYASALPGAALPAAPVVPVPSVAPVAILFDLDRTLIDLEYGIRGGIVAHLTALGLPADEEAYRAWKRLELLHVQRYVDGLVGFQQQRRDRARGMTGRDLTDAEADAWFQGFHDRMEALQRVFDDTAAALDELDRRLGVPFGIVTNMDTALQLEKMRRVGLPEARFAGILGLDLLGGHPKPHAEAFRRGCAALGVVPGPQVAFIGDDLRADAYGARDAGLRAIWLDRTGHGERLTPRELAGIERITGLAQLADLLSAPGPAGA